MSLDIVARFFHESIQIFYKLREFDTNVQKVGQSEKLIKSEIDPVSKFFINRTI